jgi:hypothetical protein
LCLECGFVALRRRASFWSARLPKPKVAGSRPVVRFTDLQGDCALRMLIFEQNDRRMAEASTTLFNLIREGRVVHDGDPQLRAHVLARTGYIGMAARPSGLRQ